MIKIDEDECKIEGELGIILAEICLLVMHLLENGVKYDLIQMAVEKGIKHYKEGEE